MQKNILSNNFNWDQFVKEYWQTKSGLFNNILTVPLATSEEIFNGLLKLAEQYEKDCDKPTSNNTIERSRAGEQRIADIKFLSKKSRIVGDLHEYMARKEDGNLQNYSKRIESLFGGSYLLYVTNFYYYVPVIWERARNFLEGLYQKVGVPADYTDLELFMGSYKLTAGGIHRDRSSNFHFVVDGQKTMHVWPRQEFWSQDLPESLKDKKLDKMYLDRYLEYGIAYKGHPGDMIYWQPNYWHAGSSDVFSASLVIAINMNGPLSKLFSQAINDIFKNKTINTIPYCNEEEYVKELQLPEFLNDGAEKLFNAKIFKNRIRLTWLQHITNYGFKYRIDPRETIIFDQDTKLILSNFTSIRYFTENDIIYIICNGYTLSLSYSSEIEELINIILKEKEFDLNTGLSKLTSKYGEQDELTNILLQVINYLYTVYALELRHI